MEDKFDPFDFNYEFDTINYDSSDPLPVEDPKPKIPLNAYKQFKAVGGGETYYLSGKERRGYRG